MPPSLIDPKTHVLPLIKIVIDRVEYPEWIPCKTAAQILHVDRNRIWVLTEECDPLTRKPYLESWKVHSHLTLVKTRSVLDHMKATQDDPEFWDLRRARTAALRR